VQQREANGLFLNQQLSRIPGIRPLGRGYGEDRHSYHLYIFRYDPAAWDGLTRQRFIETLVAEGIPCSAGYDRPLYRQPVFLNHAFGPYTPVEIHYSDYTQVCCPVSERACREACWLPHHLLLSNENGMQDIVTAIEKIFEYRKDLM